MPFVCWLVNYGSQIHPMFPSDFPVLFVPIVLSVWPKRRNSNKKTEMVMHWFIIDPDFPYELNIFFFIYLFWPATIPGPSPLAYQKSSTRTLRTPQTILHTHLPSKFESIKSSSPWLKKEVQSYISQLWRMFFSYNLKEILSALRCEIGKYYESFRS